MVKTITTNSEGKDNDFFFYNLTYNEMQLLPNASSPAPFFSLFYTFNFEWHWWRQVRSPWQWTGGPVSMYVPPAKVSILTTLACCHIKNLSVLKSN